MIFDGCISQRFFVLRRPRFRLLLLGRCSRKAPGHRLPFWFPTVPGEEDTQTSPAGTLAMGNRCGKRVQFPFSVRAEAGAPSSCGGGPSQGVIASIFGLRRHERPPPSPPPPRGERTRKFLAHPWEAALLSLTSKIGFLCSLAEDYY